jgi:hypothetical protein
MNVNYLHIAAVAEWQGGRVEIEKKEDQLTT